MTTESRYGADPEPNQVMAFGCTPPTAFNWAEEALKFFEAHPKR